MRKAKKQVKVKPSKVLKEADLNKVSGGFAVRVVPVGTYSRRRSRPQ